VLVLEGTDVDTRPCRSSGSGRRDWSGALRGSSACSGSSGSSGSGRPEAEPAAQPYAHPLRRGRPVEGERDRGPPVDDDRITPLVAYVAAPDVQRLDLDLPTFGVTVGAAEERRCVGVGGQGGEPLRTHAAETLAGQGIDAVVGDRRGALLHRYQALAGPGEMRAFGEQFRIISHRPSFT
jgi:hypothetical protein